MITGTMAIDIRQIQLDTVGEEIDLIDLTPEISDFLRDHPIKEGRLTIFVPGSTGAILATEYEPRLNQDTKRIIKQLIVKGDGYHHH